MIHSPDNYLTPSTVVHTEWFICYIYKIYIEWINNMSPKSNFSLFSLSCDQIEKVQKNKLQELFKKLLVSPGRKYDCLDWRKTVVSKHLKLLHLDYQLASYFSELLWEETAFNAMFSIWEDSRVTNWNTLLIFFSINMPFLTYT